MEKEDEISEEKEIKIEDKENLNEEIETKEELIENEEKVTQTPKEIVHKKGSKHLEKTTKSNKKVFIIIAILVIILIFLSTFFAIYNINNTNVINGVYIEEINVSDFNKEKLNEVINEKIEKIENIELYYEDYSETIKLEDLGIEVSAKDAIKEVINLGKSNNIIIDNFTILKSMLFKTKFELNITINEEKFNEMVKNIQVEIPDRIQQYSYEIKDKELIITNGKPGKAIIKDEFKNIVIENIKDNFNENNKASLIPVKYEYPDKVDINKIYNEIYKEAKDAYIIDEPFELHKEESGVDLAVSIEEAKKIVAEEKETYVIPLKITKPKIEVKDLGDKLFKETLAKYTTIYDAGVANRAHNVALAAKTINGTILLPGETFSYNGKLGNTNAANGYKEATAYVGGKVVPSYGGGICQISSTLYNAVLYANLEIVERYNHSYAVSYVPAGRDATVAYGGKDFKFKNTRSYPIKIVANAKNGVASVSIVGIKEEKEYEVVLTSSVLSTTANTTVYENNSSLPEGTEKVIQAGYTGKTSIAYKILKYNGKTISKTVLSKDTYKPMNRIVQVGTKKVESTTTPTVTQPVESIAPEQTQTPETDTNIPETEVITNNNNI